MNVRLLVEKTEREAKLPSGEEERFNGYGLMGLPFSSGHILALRRFPVTSIGPAYTSVWHRNPKGVWNFYADVPPQFACTRYFGSDVEKAEITSIEIEWKGDLSFGVHIPHYGLVWNVELEETWKTKMMNAIAGILPMAAWKNPYFLKIMGYAAGMIFDLGKVGLSGHASNKQHFVANPYVLWQVKESQATFHGEDLGSPSPLPTQSRLGDFWIPQKGIFALGRSFFEPFDPARHSGTTSIR